MGTKQVASIQLSCREVVHIKEAEETAAGGVELETVSKVTEPWFQYEIVHVLSAFLETESLG